MTVTDAPPISDATEDLVITLVEVDRLQVEPAYQREEKDKFIARIGASWSTFKAGVLHASRRPDDSLWVLDGQQRLGGAKVAGVTHVWCIIRRFAGPEAEAQMFSDLNTDRRPLSPYQHWRAAMAWHEARSIEIDRMIRARGGTVGPSGAEAVGAVTALWSIYDRHGAEHLEAVLQMLYSAFGPLRGPTCQGQFISGLSRFLLLHPKAVDRLTKKLAERTINGFRGIVNVHRSMGGIGGNAVYGAAVEIHNHNAKAGRITPGQT